VTSVAADDGFGDDFLGSLGIFNASEVQEVSKSATGQ